MLEDYLPLQPLGSGATGIVFLAKGILQEAGQQQQQPLLFAVKAFKKSREDDLQRSHNEERILSKLSLTHHPFLPRLHSAFDHGDFRFLVLDFCSGGHINSLQQSLPDKRFSSAAIRFYAAEIVLALEYLHEKGIVYRDLKPENILLSSDGHIMLTDFDLSITLPPKRVSSSYMTLLLPHEQQDAEHEEDGENNIKPSFTCLGRCGSAQNYDRRLERSRSGAALHTRHRHRVAPTAGNVEGARSNRSSISSSSSAMPRSNSFVGTEEYIAPEVIKGTGHDFGVDWWALGVLLFEMAHASTPFQGATSKETFQNVLHHEPVFPGLTSASTLSDLIMRLLVKDPSLRLGAHSGAAEIKAHPFFADLCWDALQDVCRPPFIPPCALPKLDMSGSFDVLSHLVQVEGSRLEARAKRKLQRKKASES